MVNRPVPEFAGDPRHPAHDEYLLELGRATYEAARLTGIVFAVLQVHGGAESSELYSDPLGKLERKLNQERPALDGLDEFLELLGPAREARNDLIHALPVLHGLNRRKAKDPFYVRDFYTSESLREVTKELRVAHRKGSHVLHADDGKAVKEWSQRSKS